MRRISAGSILFDLTTSAMASGTPTGIARLEADLYRAMAALAPQRIVPVAWNRRTGTYLLLPIETRPDALTPDLLDAMEADGRARELTEEIVEPGTQILFVGGTWARHRKFVEALASARLRCRAPLTVLIHDLAQIELKALYPDKTAAEFERNARRLVRIADRFFAVSQATRTDLARLLQDEGLAFKPIIRFIMGATLDDVVTGRSPGPVPPDLADFGGKRFALYVSSIEPRKNHQMLLAAWRTVIEMRGEASPMLLCVGRPVMDGQTVIDAVRDDPVLSRHVHFATGLHDEELDWCYRNAAFTVYPSLYEGWGMPIAESLLYGKFCIASDSSSMPEVGAGLVDLIDPNDGLAWARKVSFYFDNPGELATREARIRETYTPRPWRAAAQDALDAMAVPGAVTGIADIVPEPDQLKRPRKANSLRSLARRIRARLMR